MENVTTITFDELIRSLEQHPDYYKKYYKDLDAAVSLILEFDDVRGDTLYPVEFDLSNSKDLIIETDRSGQVIFVEIT